MRQLPTLLLLVAAALPLGGKWKSKDKHFDPVRITDVRQVAGRYVGIDPDFTIELRLSDEGTISGTMRNFGRTATLSQIRIHGEDFSATANATDGSHLPLHGSFVNRCRNGQSAFGLVVHDVDVKLEDLSLTQIFCRRQ
jgi:hypothetical protein